MHEPWGSNYLYLRKPELNTAFGLTAPRRSAVQTYLSSLLETAIPGFSDFPRSFSSLYDFAPFFVCTCPRLLVFSVWYRFICRLYQGVNGLCFYKLFKRIVYRNENF